MTFFKSLLTSVLVHLCIYGSVTMLSHGNKSEALVDYQQWEVELAEPLAQDIDISPRRTTVVNKTSNKEKFESGTNEPKPEANFDISGSEKKINKANEESASVETVSLAAETLHPYFKKLRRIIFLRLNSLDDLDSKNPIQIKFSLSHEGTVQEVAFSDETSKDSHQKIAQALADLKNLGAIPAEFLNAGASTHLWVHLPVRF